MVQTKQAYKHTRMRSTRTC